MATLAIEEQGLLDDSLVPDTGIVEEDDNDVAESFFASGVPTADAVPTASAVPTANQATEVDPVDPEVYEREYTTTTEEFYADIDQAVSADMSAVLGDLPAAGSISQHYGVPGNYAAGYHTGMDIAGPQGTPIRAPMGGRVLTAGWNGAFGQQVTIKMADGTTHVFAHLSGMNVRAGQNIAAGQVLGLMGNTGNSRGSHLHWEVRGGAGNYADAYDPRDWLARTQASSARSSGSRPSASSTYNAFGKSAEEITRQAYGLMRQVGATHEEARMLASFVVPESSGNPNVVNSIGATGLWQVLYPVHRDWLSRRGISQQDLKNPLTNAKAAYQIYKDRGGGRWGYSAWEVYTNPVPGNSYTQNLRYV